MKGIIRKADVVLGLALLLFCAAAAWFAYGSGAPGGMLQITVDGKVFGEYPLDQDRTVVVESSFGHNEVTIAEGRAYMSEANCPDGYCLKQHKSQGGIGSTDQTLVCLPNRVVVSVIQSAEAGNDADDLQQAPDAVAGAPAASAGGNVPDDAGKGGTHESS